MRTVLKGRKVSLRCLNVAAIKNPQLMKLLKQMIPNKETIYVQENMLKIQTNPVKKSSEHQSTMTVNFHSSQWTQKQT